MSLPLLTKAFVAEAAISAFRIVKFGTTDDLVTAAAAAADLSIGIVEGVAPAAGERCDVVMAGLAEVTAGGAVTRGQLVTADAQGRAVAAAAGNRAIGMARASGVAGDVIEVLITPSTV